MSKPSDIIQTSNEYNSVETLIKLIDEPNRSACLKLLNDNFKLFNTVQGSTHNHQAWLGGYYDHVQEVMNLAVVLYDRLNSLRTLPFSLSDLLLVVYLHDVEKPWKYELRDGELCHKPDMDTKEKHQEFRMKTLKEYGIELTPEQTNGLEYAEGEIKNYSNQKRHMGPLACVAHMCDVCSARLWFDHPTTKNSLVLKWS